MSFSTYSSIFIFLGLVLTIFFTCIRWRLNKTAQCTLLFSALIFYAQWDYRFLLLLCTSIAFNYGAGQVIQMLQNKRMRFLALFSSVSLNLIVLCYFKYNPLFSQFFYSLFHVKMSLAEAIDVAVPLSVSFFMFAQIAYLIETYHSQRHEADVVAYGLFVAVFPHLITTPVTDLRNLLDQFARIHKTPWSSSNLTQGIFLFVIGLAKKVLIADSLLGVVLPIFDPGTGAPPFFQAWMGALSYTIELYFDFSGFFDMAIGLGLMFNIKLGIEFNCPYQANSIIDFWRRWHSSLSGFLRDYLYLPITGEDNGKLSKVFNLALSLFLGCVWHGAGWTFIVWGIAHAVLVWINQMWAHTGISLSNWIARPLTFVAIMMTWVIFRSPSLETAFGILKGMVGLNGVVLPESYAHTLAFLSSWGVSFHNIPQLTFPVYDIVWVLLLFLGVSLLPNSKYLKDRVQEKVWIWAPVCTLLIAVMNIKEVSRFLYYQF